MAKKQAKKQAKEKPKPAMPESDLLRRTTGLRNNIYGSNYYELVPAQFNMRGDSTPLFPKHEKPLYTIDLAGVDVLALSEISAKQAQDLIFGYKGRELVGVLSGENDRPDQYISTMIDYPVDKPVRVTVYEPYFAQDGVESKMAPISVGYFLWTVAQAYRRIYRCSERYGVWGHCLADLRFDSMDVYSGSRIHLNVGS
jgi:hypothetical protein